MKPHRILLTLALGIALSSVLVGGAWAAGRPDDRGGMIGVGGAQVAPAPPDAFERAVLRSTSANPVPDVFERAVLRETRTALRPDDRAEGRGPGVYSPASFDRPSAGSDWITWSNAIYGSLALAAIAVVGGIAAVGHRQRRRVVLS
jgi:hypothetical protein